MKSPDGNSYPMDGEMHEIVVNKKLQFACGPLDQDNQRLFDVMTTVNFDEEGDKTRLTLRIKVINIQPGGEQYLKGITTGWSQSLERLINLVE